MVKFAKFFMSLALATSALVFVTPKVTKAALAASCFSVGDIVQTTQTQVIIRKSAGTDSASTGSHVVPNTDVKVLATAKVGDKCWFQHSAGWSAGWFFAVTKAAPTNLMSSACLSDAEMQSDFGFTDILPVFTGGGVVSDSCKWNWQSAGIISASIELKLPTNWEATIRTVSGIVAVYYGPADLKDVNGFTARFLPAYKTDANWALNPCMLLDRENDFGKSRIPAYQTVAGNFNCPGAAEVNFPGTLKMTANSCPTATTAQIAAAIGGNADNWTAPTAPGGAWVFKSADFVTLNVPGFGRIDYWNSQTNKPASLTTGSLSLEDASFHCNAADA